MTDLEHMDAGRAPLAWKWNTLRSGLVSVDSRARYTDFQAVSGSTITFENIPWLLKSVVVHLAVGSSFAGDQDDVKVTVNDSDDSIYNYDGIRAWGDNGPDPAVRMIRVNGGTFGRCGTIVAAGYAYDPQSAVEIIFPNWAAVDERLAYSGHCCNHLKSGFFGGSIGFHAYREKLEFIPLSGTFNTGSTGTLIGYQ